MSVKVMDALYPAKTQFFACCLTFIDTTVKNTCRVLATFSLKKNEKPLARCRRFYWFWVLVDRNKNKLKPKVV